MNRRDFLRTAIAAGVVAALPVLPEPKPCINAAYPPGDIRRYGAIEGQDCSDAIQAAINDPTNRKYVVYFPPGEWSISRTVSGTAFNGQFLSLIR